MGTARVSRMRQGLPARTAFAHSLGSLAFITPAYRVRLRSSLPLIAPAHRVRFRLHSSRAQVVMATNRIDILDDALLRPGRIDRKIEFPPPNDIARADILRIHSRRMNMSRDIDLLKIAEKMSGASGAECKVRFVNLFVQLFAVGSHGGAGGWRPPWQGVCTEAGMFALRERRIHVTQEDFEMAVAKVRGILKERRAGGWRAGRGLTPGSSLPTTCRS